MCHPSKIRKEFLKIVKTVTNQENKDQKLIDQLKYVHSMIRCLELNTLKKENK